MVDLLVIKNDLETFIRKVGKKAKNGFLSSDLQYTTKRNANDLLTKYDVAINTEIIQYLSKKYPAFSIITEEAPAISKKSEYSFAVDPIDGTRNFVRGIPIFFIGIGLIKHNHCVLSVTYNPMSDELFWAISGKGAYRNNHRITVSDRTLALSDIHVRTLADKKTEKKFILKLIEHVCQIKNNMCCHDELSGVACNKYDGFISSGSSVWDYCHYLLITEAGGKVTDFDGKPYDLSKKNIIASNGIIHDTLLKAVR